jgi:hypothetical protein
MGGQLATQVFDSQEGVASRAQLLAAGLTARVIDRRLATGQYRRVHRNVYALGPLSMRGRLIAALLAGGEQAALCHASARWCPVTTIERTLFDIAATGADIRKLAQEALAKRLTTLVIEVDENAHQFAFEEYRARDRFLAGLGLRTMRVTEASLRDEPCSGRRSGGLRESFADE